MTRVPVSVSTASRSDPSEHSQIFNLPLAIGVVTSPKQSHTPAVKKNFTLPPALAVKGGFTLPSNFGMESAVLNASMSKPVVSVPLIPASSSTPLWTYRYSTSRASMDNKTSTGLVRSRVSASNVLSLGASKNKSKYKYCRVVGGKIPTSKSMTEIPPLIQTVVSPQSFLEKMMQARGYSTASFRSVDGGYYCKPTSLQVASYGVKIIQAIRTSDGDLLKRMLDCSISPNACNAFGESAVHMVCRRGHHKLLKILVDAGCSLQVTDDFGRTPLHDACWTVEPSFDCVELILNADSRLLNIVDCRGSPPLSYVRREHWKQWIEFLESKADWYWPPRDVSTEGEEAPPPLVGVPPNSRPIPDPKNAIPLDMAALISSGKLDPEEFLGRQAEAPEIKQVATQALVADASK